MTGKRFRLLFDLTRASSVSCGVGRFFIAGCSSCRCPTVFVRVISVVDSGRRLSHPLQRRVWRARTFCYRHHIFCPLFFCFSRLFTSRSQSWHKREKYISFRMTFPFCRQQVIAPRLDEVLPPWIDGRVLKVSSFFSLLFFCGRGLTHREQIDFGFFFIICLLYLLVDFFRLGSLFFRLPVPQSLGGSRLDVFLRPRQVIHRNRSVARHFDHLIFLNINRLVDRNDYSR